MSARLQRSSAAVRSIDADAMRANADDAAQLLKMLANGQRLRVLCLLVGGELSVGQINERVELSQSALSQHLAKLRKEGLVTDRVPVIVRAKDGTIIEVSEWKSHQAIEEAHRNPRVLAMWEKFFAVCDCVPLKTVPETEMMFAGFQPIPTLPTAGMPTNEPLRP